MDLGFAIVSKDLFLANNMNGHNSSLNLNIHNILPILDSPGNFTEGRKDQNNFRIMWLECDMIPGLNLF